MILCGRPYIVKTDANGDAGCHQYTVNTQVTTPALLVGAGAVLGSGGWGLNGSGSGSLSPVTKDPCNPNPVIEKDDSQTMGIVIYPNPTTGKFTVTGATAPVQVFDLLGREIAAPSARNDGIVIDLSSYPAGVYIIKVGEVTTKLILTK